jgi:hypothetical protein
MTRIAIRYQLGSISATFLFSALGPVVCARQDQGTSGTSASTSVAPSTAVAGVNPNIVVRAPKDTTAKTGTPDGPFTNAANSAKQPKDKLAKVKRAEESSHPATERDEVKIKYAKDDLDRIREQLSRHGWEIKYDLAKPEITATRRPDDKCPCCGERIGGDYMCRPAECQTVGTWGPVCPPTTNFTTIEFPAQYPSYPTGSHMPSN